MSTKEIRFAVGRGQFERRTVDLTRLSETATAIALAVQSTCNRCDSGTFSMRSHESWGQKAVAQGLNDGSQATSAGYVERIRAMYGDRFVESPIRRPYVWQRTLRRDEEPEQYLEAAAREVERLDAGVDGGANLSGEREAQADALLGRVQGGCACQTADNLTSDDLREARQQLGLSQPAFAALCGVSERQVIRWERGATPVPGWVGPVVAQRQRTHEQRGAATE